MRNLLLIGCVGLFVTSPAIAQDTPKALADAFAVAIIAEDAGAVAGLYTEDATSYGPGGGVQSGRAAIAESWTSFFDGFDGFSVTLDQQGELDMGKKGHAAWGLWTMSASPVGDDAAEATVWNGRFTDVSIKTKDGWRYVADHASMLRPAANNDEAGEETDTDN